MSDDLPYIDEHTVRVDAPRKVVWTGLQRYIESLLRGAERNPLVALLGLDKRAACVVSGDTTPYSKPHPAPLLHAADALGVDARHVVYVGDDLRDIQAGHAAGMATIAAAYGYCGNDLPPLDWNAHYVADTANALLALLRRVGAAHGG